MVATYTSDGRANKLFLDCACEDSIVALQSCEHDDSVPKMEIRDVQAEDALAACRVLRHSLAELCAADHQNDPEILARWLVNKTPENFKSWIKQPRNSLLVAIEGKDIVAVGSVTDEGEITLNYVSPDARFRGVSRALLLALEARAIQRGNIRCTLISTVTGRRFYLANGYLEDAMPFGKLNKNSSYHMSRTLTQSNPWS